jgi:hypothetical protein
MYFEPSKKTYYRFPSSNSITDFDNRFYFPEKTNNFDEHYKDTEQLTNSLSSNDRDYGF